MGSDTAEQAVFDAVMKKDAQAMRTSRKTA